MDHDIVGAVWIRIMNDYGHIDDQTPSLAISVKKDIEDWELAQNSWKQC